eukprot:Amastigsp_a684213_6.p2 type:complete len:142 gc:universal Amastigsp_a684213_6:450-875(+)
MKWRRPLASCSTTRSSRSQHASSARATRTSRRPSCQRDRSLRSRLQDRAREFLVLLSAARSRERPKSRFKYCKDRARCCSARAARALCPSFRPKPAEPPERTRARARARAGDKRRFGLAQPAPRRFCCQRLKAQRRYGGAR